MKTRLLRNGFTLVELLVVMAIISLLLSLAAPRYFKSLDKSKEAVLRENLATTRQALDKFYGDNGKYPDALDELVTRKYLRSLPFDPITNSTSTWIVIPPESADKGEVYNIKSGSADKGADGIAYVDW